MVRQLRGDLVDPVITSTKNDRIRRVPALRKPRERRRQGLMVVEGFQILELAVVGGWQVRDIFYSQERMHDTDWPVLDAAIAKGGQGIPVADNVLKHLSKREGPFACVATVETREPYTLETLPLSANPLVIVTEAFEKPGNLGVTFRSASAAGADALIVTNPQTDVFDPGCIHASLGSVFVLPTVTVTTEQAIAYLAEHEIPALAATPQGQRRYYEQDMASRVAIVIGNEHRGLSDLWLNSAVPVKIDMTGHMNSLNASVAGAVMIFEAVRQRTVAGLR